MFRKIKDFVQSHLSGVPVTVLLYWTSLWSSDNLKYIKIFHFNIFFSSSRAFRVSYLCLKRKKNKIMAFTGTLDKCKACDKTVYVVDMMSLEGVPYHKSCFKCSHCKGFLSVYIFNHSFLILVSTPNIPVIIYCTRSSNV